MKQIELDQKENYAQQIIKENTINKNENVSLNR